jgi:hypothetical protein
VYQGAANGGFSRISSSVSFSYGLTTQLIEEYRRSVTLHRTGYGLIEATASRSALTRNFRSLPDSVKRYFTEPAFAFTENGRDFYTRRGVVPSANSSLEDLYRTTDEIVASLEDVLPSQGPWSARVASRVTAHTWQITKSYDELDNWSGKVTYAGAGLDFVIGFGFQWANDYGSPYLSLEQVILRSTIAGGGSVLFGGLGGAAGAFCGPAAFICVPLGAVAGGVVWSELFQPLIFQAPFLQPEDRKLKLLGV